MVAQLPAGVAGFTQAFGFELLLVVIQYMQSLIVGVI